MIRTALTRIGLVLAAWLPFFAVWVLFAMTLSRASLREAIATSLISMGSVSLLAFAVWYVCQWWPWPLRINLAFYLAQIGFACAFSITWAIVTRVLDSIRLGMNPFAGLGAFVASPYLPWQLLTGIWLYGLFAGVSYAVQTRTHLHEKETLAMRAEALAAAARLDAIRARLNPHFLFNALHTLSALVRFRPEMAESAIERLGDMLRYTLKEDGRELVEFSEEYDFTRQYLAFEQLRYEDRLKIDLRVDPECVHFDIPPFSMQTLAENAVRHAISIRPEGGSIWITCTCNNGSLTLSVRDDGPGGGPGDDAEGHREDGGTSHHFGLRSLRERLRAAYGPSVDLSVHSGPDGFEARFVVPAGDRS
jgi:two-component system, LytTR family, sensor kinase